jgi:ABC-2 type transport system permease protein
VDGAGAFAYPLVFLPFISSAVATRTMPGPVRAFADLAWCLGILIVVYALAMVTYHRKIA